MRQFVALLIACSALAGCDDPSDVERCDDLGAYLAGRDRMLDRDCTAEGSCEVYWVAPDHPVAVAAAPTDERTLDAIAAFDESCGSFGTVLGVPQASCVQQYRDEFNPDGTSYETEAGRMCELTGIFDIQPGDAGVDAGTGGPDVPADPCACTSDTACGAGSRCVACSCVADTACGRTCDTIDTCGRLDAVNLGTTGAACVASCDGAIERDPTRWNTFVACIASGGCGAIDACLTAATRP
jgi:hypothetical protein